MPEWSEEDPFVVAVRQYILDTLTPLIPTGEKTGAFMFSLLRRALRTASREDLEQVVLHCVAFTDGLRAQGFITEELAHEAETFLNRGATSDAITTGDSDPDTGTLGGTEVPGPSTVDWTDQEWQEHSRQTLDSALSSGHESGDEEGMAPPSHSGGGHEAEMEGNVHPDGAERTEAVPEDGPG